MQIFFLSLWFYFLEIWECASEVKPMFLPTFHLAIIIIIKKIFFFLAYYSLRLSKS